jgi:hypothetical protein
MPGATMTSSATLAASPDFIPWLSRLTTSRRGPIRDGGSCELRIPLLVLDQPNTSSMHLRRLAFRFSSLVTSASEGCGCMTRLGLLDKIKINFVDSEHYETRRVQRGLLAAGVSWSPSCRASHARQASRARPRKAAPRLPKYAEGPAFAIANVLCRPTSSLRQQVRTRTRSRC